MGANAILSKVTDDEMVDLDCVLKRSGDRREGQILANYDRVFKILNCVCDDLELVKPPLMMKNCVDRRSLIYFNTGEEVPYKM